MKYNQYNFMLKSIGYLMALFNFFYVIYLMKHIKNYNVYQLFLHYINIWGIFGFIVVWFGVIIPLNKMYHILITGGR